jgi:hypothetical protein
VIGHIENVQNKLLRTLLEKYRPKKTATGGDAQSLCTMFTNFTIYSALLSVFCALCSLLPFAVDPQYCTNEFAIRTAH